MPVLHNLKNISFEIDFSVKVGIVELLHRDLGRRVLLELRVLEVDVVLDRFAGERHLFIEPLAVLGHESPIANSEGDKEDDDEEDIGLEASAPRNEALNNERRNQVYCGEVKIGKGCGSLGGKGGIRNGSVGSPGRQLGLIPQSRIIRLE